MNKLLVIIVSVVMLSSCDNREVFLKELNPLPEMVLYDQNGHVSSLDSVKYALKSTKKSSTYRLVITGNNQDKKVDVQTVNSVGTVSFGSFAGDGERSIPNGTYSVTFTPTATGRTLINLTLTDNFKNKKELSTEVVTFDNLAPVASMILTNIAVVDPREYVLDASNSFDRDGSFGGFISTYTFKIANQSITTDKSSIKWIFGAAGNYECSVTVKDSDGASSTFTKIYTIQ